MEFEDMIKDSNFGPDINFIENPLKSYMKQLLPKLNEETHDSKEKTEIITRLYQLIDQQEELVHKLKDDNHSNTNTINEMKKASSKNSSHLRIEIYDCGLDTGLYRIGLDMSIKLNDIDVYSGDEILVELKDGSLIKGVAILEKGDNAVIVMPSLPDKDTIDANTEFKRPIKVTRHFNTLNAGDLVTDKYSIKELIQ